MLLLGLGGDDMTATQLSQKMRRILGRAGQWRARRLVSIVFLCTVLWDTGDMSESVDARSESLNETTDSVVGGGPQVYLSFVNLKHGKFVWSLYLCQHLDTLFVWIEIKLLDICYTCYRIIPSLSPSCGLIFLLSIQVTMQIVEMMLKFSTFLIALITFYYS